jgi:hypothetical protein
MPVPLNRCAGCGRPVVVDHVFCVECRRGLCDTPVVPHFRYDAGDRLTEPVDATLLMDVLS